MDRIRVIARVRPLARHEVAKNEVKTIAVTGEGQLDIHLNTRSSHRSFILDSVLHEKSSQGDVMSEVKF
jgi:hypothetical protein